MSKEYDEWIASYPHKNRVGACGGATKEMCKEFPELKRVPGFVSTIHGLMEHWWCVAPDGSIVDPTKDQFKGGVLSYQEVGDSDSVRLGKCMNCGAEIYGPYSVGPRSMCLPHLYVEAFEEFTYRGGDFPDICDPATWGGQHERSECEEEFILWQDGPSVQATHR